MGFNLRKKSCYLFLFVSILVLGVFKIYTMKNDIKEGEFINIEPSIILDNIEYTVTKEVLEETQLEREPIAKITSIQTLVSYSEEENPYKNPNEIYKIKNSDIELKIAIEMNDKIYLAIKKEKGKL